ncbi:MAG: LysM peptidoglycan-binding domain-containing protein [Phycisphaeraceae bacterium]
MTTETKLGLLLGMGVIILVGIFISDHLSKANSQQTAGLADSMRPLDDSDLPRGLEESRYGGEEFIVEGSEAETTLPLPEDFEAQSRPEVQPRQRQTRDARPSLEREPQQAEAPRNTRILDIDLRPTMIEREREEVIDGEAPLPDAPVASDDRTELPDELEYVEPREERRFEPEPVERTVTRESRQVTPEPEPRQTTAPVTHYVKENETLSKIADQYYGDPGYYEVIYEANRNAISNPNFVRPGVRLVIPDKAGTVARRQTESPAETTQEQPPTARTQTYTIREKDTIWALADRFYGNGAKWKELYELNKDKIDNPDRLTVGDEITVPVR